MFVLLYVTEPNQNKTFAFAFVFKMWKICIYLYIGTKVHI